MAQKMKIGSLFDGSGGFPLATSMCGMIPVWASEIEPYRIIFLNGNTLDCRIENLACVSNAVLAKMMNGHGKSFYSECPEITKTGILVCQLDIVIGRSNL